jgi:hypothetical protein
MDSYTIEDINVLQRKLTGLKDSIYRKPISPGQERFIRTYLEIISEYIEKGLDVVDEDKYREQLKLLES